VTEGYHSIEDGDHFVSCLLLVDGHMRKKHKDATDIRWIVIGLHDALYSVLIEKLTRTDGFGIFNRRFEDEVSEFYASGGSSVDQKFIELCEKSSNENVASLEGLLKRKSLNSGASIVRSEIEDQPSPTRGISWLKEMRDHHAHPRPMSRSIHGNQLSIAFEDALSVIREVANTSGRRHVRSDPEKVRILLDSISFYLRRWAAEFQNQS